jgi:dephospho-CoA kinase
MIKVAITGNIGSGKTTVCRIFQSLGIEVYFADKEARKFYQRTEVIRSVKDLFGDDVFDGNDQLISNILAERAFADSEKLNQLNSIIHPLVLDDYFKWAGQRINKAYILYESALLFESGFYKHFDYSILISAPVELALKRVSKRDQISSEDFYNRLSMQWDEEKKASMATHIILNDQSRALIPQVLELHKKFAEIGD